jgi:hypothetical protein
MLEEIIQKIRDLILRRDDNVVQTSEAIAAIERKFVEEAEADIATELAESYLADFQAKAAEFTSGSGEEDLAALVASFNAFTETQGIKQIEVGEARQAAIDAVREQAEADLAAAEAAALLEEIKGDVSAFTL